jgi:hypothetical protein
MGLAALLMVQIKPDLREFGREFGRDLGRDFAKDSVNRATANDDVRQVQQMVTHMDDLNHHTSGKTQRLGPFEVEREF